MPSVTTMPLPSNMAATPKSAPRTLAEDLDRLVFTACAGWVYPKCMCARVCVCVGGGVRWEDENGNRLVKPRVVARAGTGNPALRVCSGYSVRCAVGVRWVCGVRWRLLPTLSVPLSGTRGVAPTALDYANYAQHPHQVLGYTHWSAGCHTWVYRTWRGLA